MIDFTKQTTLYFSNKEEVTPFILKYIQKNKFIINKWSSLLADINLKDHPNLEKEYNNLPTLTDKLIFSLIIYRLNNNNQNINF